MMKNKMTIVYIIEGIIIIGLAISLSYFYKETKQYNKENNPPEVDPISESDIETALLEIALKAFPLGIEYKSEAETLSNLRMTLNELKGTYDSDFKIYEDAKCDFDKTYVEIILNEKTQRYNNVYECTNTK